MSLRAYVSVPGRRSVVVECAAARECKEVARVEKARPENQIRGAIVGIDAMRGRRPEPLVLWLYDGYDWAKELI